VPLWESARWTLSETSRVYRVFCEICEDERKEIERR